MYPFWFSGINPYAQTHPFQTQFGYPQSSLQQPWQLGFVGQPGIESLNPWALASIYGPQSVYGLQSLFSQSPFNPVTGYNPRSIGFAAPGTLTPGVGTIPTPGFTFTGGHLSPQEFLYGPHTTTGAWLSPEYLEFIRSEMLRTGKTLRTIGNTLEHENENVRTQAEQVTTAQFFYALGLLYARGIVIPQDVPGSSTREEEISPSLAVENFGESLERFALEHFHIRYASREISELIERARNCFYALTPESEQLEQLREQQRTPVQRKRAS